MRELSNRDSEGVVVGGGGGGTRGLYVGRRATRGHEGCAKGAFELAIHCFVDVENGPCRAVAGLGKEMSLEMQDERCEYPMLLA
jgi:hypothetical protein